MLEFVALLYHIVILLLCQYTAFSQSALVCFFYIISSPDCITAGGSLGPKDPLVAICGLLGGFVSRRIFRQSSTNVVRKHTFMGITGALAAFFRVPLGGSLFFAWLLVIFRDVHGLEGAVLNLLD